MSRSGSTLAGLLAGSILVSCSLVETDATGGRREELERARARWEAVGPDAYRYVVERRCFCVAPAAGPVVVTVAGGRVDRTYEETGADVPDDLRSLFPTVDGLFDAIGAALESGAHRVDVRYDPATGVPLDSYIDWDEGVVDEEVRYLAGAPAPLSG